jgi:multiple sugar transport system substrate-binding protein
MRNSHTSLRYLLVSIVLLTVLVVGPCLTVASAAEAPSGTITLYYWDENQKPGMDKVIEMYEQASDVKVETTIIPWAQYWTKLQTSLPSDNGPDVFWSNLAHAIDYYPAGLVEPIDSYVQRDGVDLTPFPQALIDMYSYDGKLYGLPKDYDTIALFYNKAIFDAKQVAYPTDEWTWDDLLKAAQALTDESTFGFLVPQDGQSLVYPFVLSNEGTLQTPDRTTLNYDNPQTIEAIQWLMDLINVHKVSPTGAQFKELTQDQYFQAGLAAMTSAGSWMVPPFIDALGDNLGVARLPISKKEANVIHGLSFNISANSKNKEAAWGLIKMFATKEAGEAQAQVVIPAYTGADKVWQDNYPTLNLKVFIDAAAYSEVVPACTIASAAQDDIVATAFENIWIGGQDISAACKDIDAKAAEAIAAAK